MACVSFHLEQTDFIPHNQTELSDWLSAVCQAEGKQLADVSIIFCSDEFLLEVNRRHLNHDFYTDVITFDYSEGVLISGDVFISVDRVTENATEFNAPFEDELHRVIVHGVLHLLGYRDKNGKEKEQMTEKEDIYLSSRSF